MVSEGIILAAITAIFFGLLTVFHNQASVHINPIFGAILLSLTAVVVGSIVLLTQLKGLQLFTNEKGIIFVVLAGIVAFSVDFLALKTYSSGIPVSIGGPIIIGGSIVIASVIGLLFLGESVGVLKVLGIALVVAGAGILASLSA